MKSKLVIASAILSLATPLFAHRLDEYLQAIIVSVERGRVQASMRLIPGVAVSDTVITAVDSNGDGTFSRAEQETYAKTVLRDLSLSVDGKVLKPQLRTVDFPQVADIKRGLGEIHLELFASLPSDSSKTRLIIENRHQPRMSVYLMNCLIPGNSSIRVVGQSRNRNQSYYQLDYEQSDTQGLARWRSAIVSALGPFAGVPDMFRLGMHHIAEGTDHLMFLLVLLLPAPLLASRFRWASSVSIRRSLFQILRVVTAFTIGHSITLALGASGVVSLPERVVETLIALSILISAAHAYRPFFPGREPFVAAFFGLIHGLAFATTLQNLGVSPWQRLASILGFNLGIETMQLIVVAAILPSLILLSRTAAYGVLRKVGAAFTGFASLGWIIERLFDVDCSVDLVVNGIAQRGTWLALSLLAIGVSASAWRRMQESRLAVVGKAMRPSWQEFEPMMELTLPLNKKELVND